MGTPLQSSVAESDTATARPGPALIRAPASPSTFAAGTAAVCSGVSRDRFWTGVHSGYLDPPGGIMARRDV